MATNRVHVLVTIEALVLCATVGVSRAAAPVAATALDICHDGQSSIIGGNSLVSSAVLELPG